MNNEIEIHYIIFEGIRIGFFQNKDDAKIGQKETNKGMVISKNDWEKYYEVKK